MPLQLVVAVKRLSSLQVGPYLSGSQLHPPDSFESLVNSRKHFLEAINSSQASSNGIRYLRIFLIKRILSNFCDHQTEEATFETSSNVRTFCTKRCENQVQLLTPLKDKERFSRYCPCAPLRAERPSSARIAARNRLNAANLESDNEDIFSCLSQSGTRGFLYRC